MECTAKIKLPVFDYTVNIIVTSSIYGSRKSRSNILGLYTANPGTLGLHSWEIEGFQSFIFFTPDSTVGTIAHECSHCVAQVFKAIGAEFEDEIFAYHLGYLVDKCAELQQKHRRSRNTPKRVT